MVCATTQTNLSSFDLTGRRALLDAGAVVVLHGLDATQVAAVVDRLGAESDRRDQLDGVAFDVNDVDAMRAGVDELEGRLGGIDVLVNNAGMSYSRPLIDVPIDEWNRVVSTNLTSCYSLGQHVVPGMLERGQGKIINICSVFNRLRRDRVGPYATGQGGTRRAHPDDVREPGRRWHSGQCHRPGLHRDGHDQEAARRPEVRLLATRQGFGLAVGDDRRPRGHRGLPRLECRRLHQWPGDLRRQRSDRRPVITEEPLDPRRLPVSWGPNRQSGFNLEVRK